MNGQDLARSIFGDGPVDRDWAGYEDGVELRVADRVVSHVGLTERVILLEGVDTAVAGIGFVCTEPTYRSMGLATALMKAAHQRAQLAGLPWALLNAIDTPLYRRLGYYQAPNLLSPWWVCNLHYGNPWNTKATVDLKGTW